MEEASTGTYTFFFLFPTSSIYRSVLSRCLCTLFNFLCRLDRLTVRIKATVQKKRHFETEVQIEDEILSLKKVQHLDLNKE